MILNVNTMQGVRCKNIVLRTYGCSAWEWGLMRNQFLESGVCKKQVKNRERMAVCKYRYLVMMRAVSSKSQEQRNEVSTWGIG